MRIRLRGLSKGFRGHRVLDGLDLDIDAGERVALLGLNGSGKTTLIRCLLGLVPFDGEVEVAGHRVPEEGPAARGNVGYVPQRAPGFSMTLGEMIDFFARLRGGDPDAVVRRIAELGLDLEGHGEKQIGELSGGMVQKLLVGLAMAQEPGLLLLDEPTASLDPRARRDVLRMIARVPDDTAVLLASHRLSDVEAIATRLLVIHDGRIRFDGGLPQLRELTRVGPVLWVHVANGSRDRAVEHLSAVFGAGALRRNGASLGVPMRRAAPAEVLEQLKDEGIKVDELWTEAPSLNEMLANLLDTTEQSSEVES